MLLRAVGIITLAALIGCAAPSPRSAYNLGVDAYRIKDYHHAREQWSKAATEGETSALNNLGYLMYYGLGGLEDRAGALALWRKAAVLGHSEAQWHLGHSFEDGTGVEKSYIEAYAWYRCAIASTEAAAEHDRTTEAEIAKDARTSLTRLLERLPPEQFASAEALAKKYIGKYARRKAEA